MKKVAIMYDFFSEHGGIERLMLFQGRVLKKAGFDVCFAFAYVDEKFQQERLKGFKVIEYARLPVKNETLQISSSVLRSEIANKFRDFDLIICHSFPSSYLAYRINKKFKVPYIQYVHHPPQFLYNAKLDWAKNSFKRKFSFFIGKVFRGLLRRMDRTSLEGAQGIVVMCKTLQRIVKETYGINSQIKYPALDKRFRVLKCGLQDIVKYGIKKNYILGSGRIVRLKRFDYMLTAFSKLPKVKRDNLQLVLAGKDDPQEKERLEEIAKNLNVQVLFLGPVDIEDLVKIYNLAKATVLTCPGEWFGAVHLESLACGCPVVAWKDNFGHQENIVEGVNGFLAKPYIAEDLAKKIELSLAKKWNKKKISCFVKKFDAKKIEKEFIRDTKLLLSGS